MLPGPLYSKRIFDFTLIMSMQIQKALGHTYQVLGGYTLCLSQEGHGDKYMIFNGTQSMLTGHWSLHELNTVSEVFQAHGVYLAGKFVPPSVPALRAGTEKTGEMQSVLK